MWTTMRRVLLATAMAMTCALCYPHSALGNPSWWTQAFDRWGNPNKAVMQERYHEIDRAIARGDKKPELLAWRAWLAKELGLWQVAENDYRLLQKNATTKLEKKTYGWSLSAVLWHQKRYAEALRAGWGSGVLQHVCAGLLLITALLIGASIAVRQAPQLFSAAAILGAVTVATFMNLLLSIILQWTVAGVPSPVVTEVKGIYGLVPQAAGWVVLLCLSRWLCKRISFNTGDALPAIRPLAFLGVLVLIALVYDAVRQVSRQTGIEQITISLQRASYLFMAQVFLSLTLGAFARAYFFVITCCSLIERMLLASGRVLLVESLPALPMLSLTFLYTIYLWQSFAFNSSLYLWATSVAPLVVSVWLWQAYRRLGWAVLPFIVEALLAALLGIVYANTQYVVGYTLGT